MTGEDLQTMMQGLGVDADFVAGWVETTPRTVSRWIRGRTPIPAYTEQAMDLLFRISDEEVTRLVEAFRGVRSPVMQINRADQMPASWQRAIAFRVRLQVPDLLVVGFG